MNLSNITGVCALLLLASCAEVNAPGTTSQGSLDSLPEGVLEIAAPHQNLSDVRIDAEDGCYVWRHAGPVETTYLPLRTTQGNPICTRAPDA